MSSDTHCSNTETISKNIVIIMNNMFDFSFEEAY